MLFYIIAIIVIISIIAVVIEAAVSIIGAGAGFVYSRRKIIITSIIGIAVIWWILNNLEFAISHWYAFAGCIAVYYIFKKVKQADERKQAEREKQAKIEEEERKRIEEERQRKMDEQLRKKVLETVDKMGMADVNQVASMLGISGYDTSRYLRELVLTRDLEIEDWGNGKKLYKTNKRINGNTVYEVEEINLD